MNAHAQYALGTFLGENRQNQDFKAWPHLFRATQLDEFKPDHFFNLAIVSSRIATTLQKNPTMKIEPQVDFLDVAQSSFNNVIAMEQQQAKEFEDAAKRVTMINSDSKSWKVETNARSLVRKWGRVRGFLFILLFDTLLHELSRYLRKRWTRKLQLARAILQYCTTLWESILMHSKISNRVSRIQSTILCMLVQ